MMGLENPIHLLFILAVLLMLFGAKRLPEMGRGIGSGMRGFKEALSGNIEPPQVQVQSVTGELTPASLVAVHTDSTVDAS